MDQIWHGWLSGLRWLLLCALLIAGGARADEAPRPPLVAVDVGHTLAAPGAVSARGINEFDFNRALARQLVDALRARGLRAELINEDGLIASLPARAEAAAALGADLLLSVHHDSVNADELQYWQWHDDLLSYNDQWAGHSLFVSRRNPHPARSLACARRIGAYLQIDGFTPTDKNARKRAWADQTTTVHWFDDLIVLYRARMPALLFEAGVIKHRDEELLLADPVRQAHMASTLARAVADCLAGADQPGLQALAQPVSKGE